MTRRPRILWVSYTGTWVGPTNSLSLLLEHLEPRFDSTVLSTGEGAFTDLLTQRGIPYGVVPVMSRRMIPAATRFIRKGRYDLVYGNCTSGVSATAAAASALARVPYLCHIRSMWVERHGMRRWLLRLSDGQIAVSRAAADAFARYVRGARPEVVYNGVPVDRPQPEREPARGRILQELRLAEDTILILSVGHVMVRKGQLDAVAAMERVVRASPRAVLLLVGRLEREPGYVRELEASIRARNLEDNVRLLGFRRDIDALTAASDVQVHTAGNDPHPRAVLEGMLGGLPTVAYAVDGVAETVVDNVTGFLAPAGDTAGLAEGLVTLARDPRTRSAMGQAARARVVKEYDAADTARRVGDIIDRTLGRA